MKKFYLLSLVFLTLGMSAEVSQERLAQIEREVSTMGVLELTTRNQELALEQTNLKEEQVSTQNPSTYKSITTRLSEIVAEMNAIQKR